MSKKEIGFLHAFISVFGGITLSYLTMMCFAKYIPADDAIKIVPTFIITPILIPIYFMWILFSKSIISSAIKVIFLGFILILVLKITS